MRNLLLTTVLYWTLSQVSGCDEFSVQEVSNQFKLCTSQIPLKPESLDCINTASFLECSSILEFCSSSSEDALETTIDHLKEALNVVTDESLEELLVSNCDVEIRSKRSPKRGGGGGRSSGGSRGSSSSSRGSSGSRSSSTRSRVTSAVKKIFGSGGRSSKPKVSKPKSKSKLKKFGKYAIAGLAAYGTYKLGKKMAKGVRNLYDDDDCWEYSPFQDQYRCVCNQECNNYVGSATTLASKWTVVTVTSLVLLLSNKFIM